MEEGGKAEVRAVALLEPEKRHVWLMSYRLTDWKLRVSQITKVCSCIAGWHPTFQKGCLLPPGILESSLKRCFATSLPQELHNPL